MINYLNLPLYIKNFVISNDFKNLCHEGSYHGWTYQPIKDFIIDEGIDWFESLGFVLPDILSLFRIPANHQGHIHNDINSLTKYQQYAINIVLDGKGEMQWVDNIKGNKIVARQNNVKYFNYDKVQSFDIVDTWQGDIGLVRIDSWHRILCFDQPRYCISIRPIEPKTFEEAAGCFMKLES